jgi:ubiquinol-cytochrome c reductase cytochrome b subunit
MGGYFLESNNFIPANSLKGPPHIAPVWYFTPYYSILRATTSQFVYALMAAIVAYVGLVAFKTRLSGFIKALFVAGGAVALVLLSVLDAKFFGVVLMGVSVVILGGLPWLDRSPVKSIRYRPSWHKFVYIVFAIAFLRLGYLGTLPPTDARTLESQIWSFVYLGFFLLMPWWSAMGTCKPVPTRVTFHAH